MRPHRHMPEAEAIDDAGGEVLHQHIGLVDHPPDRLLAEFGFEIEFHTALVAIHAHEVAALAIYEWRPPVTGVIPGTGTLDLDHIGTEIGEHHRAVRAGHHPGEIENANARKRAAGSRDICHALSPLALKRMGSMQAS